MVILVVVWACCHAEFPLLCSAFTVCSGLSLAPPRAPAPSGLAGTADRDDDAFRFKQKVAITDVGLARYELGGCGQGVG